MEVVFDGGRNWGWWLMVLGIGTSDWWRLKVAEATKKQQQ